MITLTKISETSSKITLGWTPVPGCIGYVFYADDTRVSNTWDPNKSQVTFSKGPAKLRVDAVGVEDSGSYPPAPVPTGILRDKPPGWNGGDPTLASSYPGYTVVSATTVNQNLGLNDNTDYFINVSSISWSSQSSGRSIGLNIVGGRNVVVVGADLLFNSTNNLDDSTAVLVSDGNPVGKVYLEGINGKCCNGITLRTKREVIIQNCRIEVSVFNDDSSGGSGIHPDIIQVWGTQVTSHAPVKSIRLHKFTGITHYTGLSVLVEANPASLGTQTDPIVWDNLEVDLHPKHRNGHKDAGNMLYLCDSPTGNAGGPYTEWKGDIYIELPTGGGGAYTRGIDDIMVLRAFTGGGAFVNFPYEIHTSSGATVYTSPNPPPGGTGQGFAQTVGNYLTLSRVSKFIGLRAIVQDGSRVAVPPFSGAGYVSPGYL